MVQNKIDKLFEDYLEYCKLLKLNKNDADVLYNYILSLEEDDELFGD